MRHVFAAIAILVSLAVAGTADGQVFGKNKVQYREFEWQILSTDHFDIYFYEGGRVLAETVADIAEDAHVMLSRRTGHTAAKRIPILVYNCHADFQQTNVITEIISEGTGGFTEIFKNRVVIPFQGSYEDLRHVVTHELTHAFMFDQLYGGLLESIFARQYLFQVPLWFAEGLAEHMSEEWDTEADRVIRDAVVNEWIPPLEYTGGYMVYKEGQAALRFIEETYGAEKIPEILQALRDSRNMDAALERTIGVPTPKLSEKLLAHLKKVYWPQVAEREDLADKARKLTDHEKDASNINLGPAISPDGERIVFVSDRDGFSDVYLMSALDGKIIRRLLKGERSGKFQELAAFRSTMCWAPDSRRVAFVARSVERHVLYVMDSENGKILQEIPTDLDAMSSPTWSPEGDRIVVSGLRSGFSDLYEFSLGDESVTRLTHDIFDERAPVWSRDGRYVAYSSDEPWFESATSPLEVTRTHDLFLLDMTTGEKRRLTHCLANDQHPAWSPDGKYLAFVSDRSGTDDLHLLDLDRMEVRQLTRVMGGIFTPSWSLEGNRLVFSVFQKAGWDVYALRDPLDLEPVEEQEAPYVARTFGDSIMVHTAALNWPVVPDSLLDLMEEDETPVGDGERWLSRYRVSFSPDYIGGGLQYNSAVGAGGSTQLTVSDVLGNHRFFLATNFFTSFEEMDFLSFYYHLPRRTDYGFGLFHYKNYFYGSPTLLSEPLSQGDGNQFFSERNYGLTALASRPFNRFQRVEFDVTLMRIERKVYEFTSYYGTFPPLRYQEDETLLLPRIALVHDTALWGMLGAVNGARCYAEIRHSLRGILGNERKMTTGIVDLRKYVPLSRDYTFAMRALGAVSAGENAQYFYLGGGYLLRGYRDFEFRGHGVGLFSLELRYPFIRYLALGWPLPIALGNIGGAMFMDVGSAWDSIRTVRVARSGRGGFVLDDVHASFGLSVRWRFGYFPIRVDFAWPTDFSHVDENRVHFTLGGDF
ncbi:MAG: PD40 domain-containing protein [Candidatus Eisenbacteria sp.]|nr:PD40 domain-containing protein [Candidatus Eisenbacteria bacterium]